MFQKADPKAGTEGEKEVRGGWSERERPNCIDGK
jgi:hypothetical protein